MKRLTVMVFVLTVLFGLGCFIVPEAPAQTTTQILIGGGRTDDAWYPFSQALAKFINEKSKWLKAEAVSTAGISGNFDMVKEKPDKYIGISSFSQIHYRPGHEYSKKRGAYTGDRFIATASTMTQCLITYDPNLKTVKDLAGKVVDVGRKGARTGLIVQGARNGMGLGGQTVVDWPGGTAAAPAQGSGVGRGGSGAPGNASVA